MEKTIDYKNLKDEEKYMTCLLFSDFNEVKKTETFSNLIDLLQGNSDSEENEEVESGSPLANKRNNSKEEKIKKLQTEDFQKIASEEEKTTEKTLENSINKTTSHIRERKNLIMGKKNFDASPFPIFKIKDIPNENNPSPWFKNMKKDVLHIPTFVGKFKELVHNYKPQMILEDSEGNEINIILNIDEDFDYLQEWMLELKYEIGKYVFVYDAFKIEIGSKRFCIVIDSFQKMSNENWICRLKPKRGISAKYIPKIVFALFILLLCYKYDLK